MEFEKNSLSLLEKLSKYKPDGIKEGLLFKKGEIIRKVKQEDMVKVLKEEILKMTNN